MTTFDAPTEIDAESVADLDHRWATLREKLQAFADDLGHQGQLRRKTIGDGLYWVVRFLHTDNGRRVRRTIYVGKDDQPELIQRVRLLLEHFRQRAAWAAEVASFARFAALAAHMLRRRLQVPRQPRPHRTTGPEPEPSSKP